MWGSAGVGSDLGHPADSARFPPDYCRVAACQPSISLFKPRPAVGGGRCASPETVDPGRGSGLKKKRGADLRAESIESMTPSLLSGLADENPDRAVLGVERSTMARAWRDRLGPVERAKAAAIAQRHELPDILARVLAGRGVEVDAVRDFLDPTLKRLMPDPSSLVDMDRAAERLADAVEAGERVALFGDYDVDGATSVALVARVLGALGLKPLIHIPDRLTEGYGPNEEAIERLAGEGARLLLTLDCGTTSFGPLGHAARLGLDVVVIDHHQANPELPDVVALVNPNRQDDLSDLGALAACGVSFMAMVALLRALRRRGYFKTRAEPDLLTLLDLVALGTVADVVPLKGLNRAFVTRGLAVAKARRNPGLAALSTVARLSGPPSAYHLGFLIGPRINAGGRIGNAVLGARCLITDDPGEAEALARDLDQLNKERQALETVMLEDADAQAFQQGGERATVLCVASDAWHPGIVGLIAARLKERYRRPAFALAIDGGSATGSGRSIPGVDLGAAVRGLVSDGLLAKGGGHAMAAGLTIPSGEIDRLKTALIDRLSAAVSAHGYDDRLNLDGVVTASALTVEFVQRLEKAGPFGSGNPEPMFAIPNQRIIEASVVGQGHVRATLGSGDGTRLKAMAFRAAETDLGRTLFASIGQTLHVVGLVGLDHWQGDARVQLRLVDCARLS